jgi:hypothetical protein
MTKVLTDQKIYKTSFSKYGTAYENMIMNQSRNDMLYKLA